MEYYIIFALVIICLAEAAYVQHITNLWKNTVDKQDNASLVKLKEIASEPSDCKYKDCEIEYFPSVDQYYIKYKGKYIYLWTIAKEPTLYKDSWNGSSYNTELQAKKGLDTYLNFNGFDTKIIKLCN